MVGLSTPFAQFYGESSLPSLQMGLTAWTLDCESRWQGRNTERVSMCITCA